VVVGRGQQQGRAVVLVAGLDVGTRAERDGDGIGVTVRGRAQERGVGIGGTVGGRHDSQDPLESAVAALAGHLERGQAGRG
jgi:hypothetical protein